MARNTLAQGIPGSGFVGLVYLYCRYMSVSVGTEADCLFIQQMSRKNGYPIILHYSVVVLKKKAATF